MSRNPDFDAVMIKKTELERLRAEVERLREQVASLQASSGYEASIAQLEIERLRAALEQAVDDFGEGHCVCEQTKQECIRALEPKP